MPAIQRIEPRVHQGVSLNRVTPSAQSLYFVSRGTKLLFYKGCIIAAITGDVCYFNCDPGAEQRTVNEWADNRPQVRSSADEFDFVVGQILTQAGLPLTRRTDAASV